MSENVDLLARIYERFNAGELALELFHPGVRLVQSTRVVGTAGTFEGHDGLKRSWAELLEGFEQVRFEPERYEELDNGTVVVVTRWVGKGVASGVPVDAPVWHVWRIEHGLATSLEVHASERAARAAAQPS